MVSAEGEAMRPLTWVTIEEVASGDLSIAGKAPHTGDIVAGAPLPGSRAHHGVPAADAAQIAGQVAMPTPPRGSKALSGVAPVARGHTFAVARQPRERSLTDL